MPHVSGGSAPVFELEGISVTGLASPSRGSRETGVWRLHMQPKASPGRHALDREEIFVALSGSAEFQLPGEKLTVKAGDALIVPAHTFFSFEVQGTTPFEAIAVLPVGAKARREQGEPFTPPWAE